MSLLLEPHELADAVVEIFTQEPPPHSGGPPHAPKQAPSELQGVVLGADLLGLEGVVFLQIVPDR